MKVRPRNFFVQQLQSILTSAKPAAAAAAAERAGTIPWRSLGTTITAFGVYFSYKKELSSVIYGDKFGVGAHRLYYSMRATRSLLDKAGVPLDSSSDVAEDFQIIRETWIRFMEFHAYDGNIPTDQACRYADLLDGFGGSARSARIPFNILYHSWFRMFPSWLQGGYWSELAGTDECRVYLLCLSTLLSYIGMDAITKITREDYKFLAYMFFQAKSDASRRLIHQTMLQLREFGIQHRKIHRREAPPFWPWSYPTYQSLLLRAALVQEWLGLALVPVLGLTAVYHLPSLPNLVAIPPSLARLHHWLSRSRTAILVSLGSLWLASQAVKVRSLFFDRRDSHGLEIEQRLQHIQHIRTTRPASSTQPTPADSVNNYVQQ